MLRSIDPNATPADIESALYGTFWTPDTAQPAGDIRYGHGIVDAEAAADALVASNRRTVGTTAGESAETDTEETRRDSLRISAVSRSPSSRSVSGLSALDSRSIATTRSRRTRSQLVVRQRFESGWRIRSITRVTVAVDRYLQSVSLGVGERNGDRT